MDPNQYYSRFSNLYGNVPPMQGPSFFGMSPGQGGVAGGLMQSLGPMIAEMFREQFGGYGFMFGSDMNIASARMANQFMLQMSRARSAGAAADQDQIRQIFRGLAIGIGNRFERQADGRMDLAPDVLRSIDVLAADAGQMLPFLASAFPDTIDRLLPRGSMAVAAGSFVNAGRFVIDPATGRAASRDADMAARVLKPLLDQGPQATFGLGAGRLGQIYEELVSQGMIGSGRDLRNAVEARELSGGLFGIGMGGDEARNIQGGRIRDRIQAYSRTISAINDIFAENGRPNAPLAELVRSLQTLTQGGMSVYDPAALAGIARSIQSAAQVSGIGIQGLTQLAAYSGSALEQYGGARGLAAPIALRAAAYGMVFADRGFGTPSPEGMSREDFVQAIAANQAAFAGSPVGNAIGAISALGRQAPAGSTFALLAEAVRRGETRVTLPGGRVVDLTSDMPQIAEIARQSGLGGAYLQQLMATTLNKAEFVREPGMMLAGQRLQRTEFENLLLTQLGAGFSGVDPGDLLRNIYDISGQSGITSDADVARLVGERMGLSPELRGNLGAALAIAGGRTRGSSGYTAARQFDPKAAEEAAKSLKFIQERGIRMEELSGLMRGGFVRNISNLFVRAGVEGGFPGMGLSILRGLGLVTNEDVAGAMTSDTDPLGDIIKSVWGGRRGFFQDTIADFTESARAGPEGSSAFATLLRSARRSAGGNPFRDGRGAAAIEEGAGLFEGVADWAQKAAGKKAAAGSGPIKIEVAQMIIRKDGGATISNLEGSAVGRK